MRRPGIFARPDVVERTTVRGPHPVAAFVNAIVDGMAGRGMAGHNGTIRIGEPSSPSRRAAGELGPHQSFRGGVPLALHTADRKGFNTALPNTHGPVAKSDPVLDLLARTQNLGH
jgi:hypothetical protein